jgi:DNA-3-methyladenine glycosylase II
LFTLHPHPPYHFGLLLDLLRRFAYPLEEVPLGDALYRVIELDGSRALIRVTGRGEADDPALDVEVVAAQGAVDPDAVRKALSHILAVESDSRARFAAFAWRDERLWQVVGPLYGLPVTRSGSLFEALIQVIIEQQIAWKAALRGQRWLLEWADRGIAHDGHTFYAFPTPAQLAAATVEELTPLKITFKRMGLIIDLARRAADGSLDLDRLSAMEAAQAYAELLKLKGIGPWTAAVTLGRALGHHHFLACNDVALQAAVNRYFHGDGERPSAALVEATLSPYGEWAGLAAEHTLTRWVLDEYPIRQP